MPEWPSVENLWFIPTTEYCAATEKEVDAYTLTWKETLDRLKENLNWHSIKSHMATKRGKRYTFGLQRKMFAFHHKHFCIWLYFKKLINCPGWVKNNFYSLGNHFFPRLGSELHLQFLISIAYLVLVIK